MTPYNAPAAGQQIKTSAITHCYFHTRGGEGGPLFSDGGNVCVQLHRYAVIPLEVFHDQRELEQAIKNAKSAGGVEVANPRATLPAAAACAEQTTERRRTEYTPGGLPITVVETVAAPAPSAPADQPSPETRVEGLADYLRIMAHSQSAPETLQRWADEVDRIAGVSACPADQPSPAPEPLIEAAREALACMEKWAGVCNTDGYYGTMHRLRTALAPSPGKQGQQGDKRPLNGIAATDHHGEGAIARCSYCGRYSLDRKTLGEDRYQPVCECGEKHGWSGSFVKPGPDARWSGASPAPTEEPRTDGGEASDDQRPKGGA